MGNYLLVYHGGSMPDDDVTRKEVTDAWGAWFGQLGDAVVDPGNPTSATKVLGPDGSVTGGGTSAPTGYTILKAGSHDAAVELARGCPVLLGGASIEVAEIFEVM
jgi:hypothetical protein